VFLFFIFYIEIIWSNNKTYKRRYNNGNERRYVSFNKKSYYFKIGKNKCQLDFHWGKSLKELYECSSLDDVNRIISLLSLTALNLIPLNEQFDSDRDNDFERRFLEFSDFIYEMNKKFIE